MRKTVNELLEEARSKLERLSPQEALSALEEGALLVDTRSEADCAADGGIPGALNIPLSVLEWRADPESESSDPRLGDLDARLIVICAHGYSSSLAAGRLQEIGFKNATDVVGGFEAWKNAGLPVAGR